MCHNSFVWCTKTNYLSFSHTLVIFFLSLLTVYHVRELYQKLLLNLCNYWIFRFWSDTKPILKWTKYKPLGTQSVISRLAPLPLLHNKTQQQQPQPFPFPFHQNPFHLHTASFRLSLSHSPQNEFTACTGFRIGRRWRLH